MKVYIVQDYACVIMGVFATRREANKHLQDGWYVTKYEVQQPKTQQK